MPVIHRPVEDNSTFKDVMIKGQDASAVARHFLSPITFDRIIGFYKVQVEQVV